jgi:hypothetical protein
MQGIYLKESKKMFGFIGGFSFWFRWSFIDPVKMFYYVNFSHRPYCFDHGFFLKCDKDCTAPKLYSRKEIKEKMNRKI